MQCIHCIVYTTVCTYGPIDVGVCESIEGNALRTLYFAPLALSIVGSGRPPPNKKVQGIESMGYS